MSDETMPIQSLPQKPENGWHAWLATIGYISTNISPDAMLTVRIDPSKKSILPVWTAAATWGQFGEEVSAAESLAKALDQLWRKVDSHHHIFKSIRAAVRQPKGYGAHEWLDAETRDLLGRIISVTQTAFLDDWSLIIVYQPSEKPDVRVRGRLLAPGRVQVSGNGNSLREACSLVYRNAAPRYFSSVHGQA